MLLSQWRKQSAKFQLPQIRSLNDIINDFFAKYWPELNKLTSTWCYQYHKNTFLLYRRCDLNEIWIPKKILYIRIRSTDSENMIGKYVFDATHSNDQTLSHSVIWNDFAQITTMNYMHAMKCEHLNNSSNESHLSSLILSIGSPILCWILL